MSETEIGKAPSTQDGLWIDRMGPVAVFLVPILVGVAAALALAAWEASLPPVPSDTAPSHAHGHGSACDRRGREPRLTKSEGR